MRFLRRNQYLLCFLAVLVLSCVMVVRQYLANQSAHVELREDFILLQQRDRPEACARLYQVLIQQLPGLDEKALVDDLQRTSMLVDPQKAQSDNLVWKYYVSVKNELEKRSEQRLARAMRRAEKP